MIMNNVSLISKEFTKEAATSNIGIDCMLYTNCKEYSISFNGRKYRFFLAARHASYSYKEEYYEIMRGLYRGNSEDLEDLMAASFYSFNVSKTGERTVFKTMSDGWNEYPGLSKFLLKNNLMPNSNLV